ncbi:hypothetical protein ACFQYP_65270 [Nonomuraea antimicrobica]
MNGFDDDRAAARAVRKLSRQVGADRRTDREQGYEFPKALRIGAPWALIPLTFLAAAVLQLAFSPGRWSGWAGCCSAGPPWR